MSRDSLAELQALAARDADLRVEADRLRALDAEIARLRIRVEAVAAFLEELPDRRGHLEAELREARDDVDCRRRELAASETQLERATDEEGREHEARARERAADHLAVALASADRAAAARGELEREAAEMPRALAALHAETASLGEALADVPTPTDEPAAMVDWASHAHASLFVAAGTLDAQRDRLVREANELGSLLLGEPTYGSTVEQVAARAAAALAPRR